MLLISVRLPQQVLHTILSGHWVLFLYGLQWQPSHLFGRHFGLLFHNWLDQLLSWLVRTIISLRLLYFNVNLFRQCYLLRFNVHFWLNLDFKFMIIRWLSVNMVILGWWYISSHSFNRHRGVVYFLFWFRGTTSYICAGASVTIAVEDVVCGHS